MDYSECIIKMSGLATTIPVMEWIRDNGCPDLCYTSFEDSRGNGLMVSNDDELGRLTEENVTMGLDSWFEYEGMKRNGCCRDGWVFCIDGKYYYASML